MDPELASSLEELGAQLRDRTPPLEITFHRSEPESAFSSRLAAVAGVLNRAGDAGVHLHDAVIGASASPPVPFTGPQ